MQESNGLAAARASIADDRPARNRIRASLRGIAKAGARNYERGALTRLLGLWPHEIADRSLPGTATLLVKIRTAIRAERRRGLAGHWTYDLDRHLGLLGAYKAELSHLRSLERSRLERDACDKSGRHCEAEGRGNPGEAQ